LNWNPHYRLAGQHARLSASKYSWLNYDREKFIDYITNSLAAAHGTKLHEFAAMAIASFSVPNLSTSPMRNAS
jgi:hypothetical protein